MTFHDPREATPPHEPDRPSLAYRNAYDDRPASRLSHLVASAAATALIWIGAVAGLLYFAFTLDYQGISAPSGTTGIRTAFAGWATLLGMMVVLSVRWRRRPERHHYVFGIWIGFAVACLVEGICFASFQ